MTFWPDLRGQAWGMYRLHETDATPKETAADLTRAVRPNPPFLFTLGWRTLTAAEAGAIVNAGHYSIGTVGLYLLEWKPSAETDLFIGTGTGSGDITFDLRCRLTGDSVVDSGLTVTKDGTPVAYTLATDTGTYHKQHRVTIAGANNTNGATFRASWTSARRRRTAWPRTPIAAQPRGNTKLWMVRAELEGL
jgi:hypothetical protein